MAGRTAYGRLPFKKSRCSAVSAARCPSPVGQGRACSSGPYTEETVDRYLPILVRLPDDLDIEDSMELAAYIAHLLDVMEAGGITAGIDGRYERGPDGARLN